MKSILTAKVLSFQYDNDLDVSVPKNMKLLGSIIINPLMPGGNKKDTYLNKPGLFKYVWPFCYHHALKG